MRRIAGLSMLFLLMLASSASARLWYVTPDGTGQVINIQAGIDSCGSGDTVLVAPGLFRGDGNRDLDFKGKAILVISELRYDPMIVDSTMIDCESTTEALHRGFWFHSGETNASVLEGLVVMNGGDYWSAFAGGGILCDSTSCPTLRYNAIRNCKGSHGGGMYCSHSSSPVIVHNDISSSSAHAAGCGIYCVGSSPLIAHNRIHNNYASMGTYGGGIYCKSSSAVIDENDIYRNDVDFALGAGICCDSCPSITVSNNRVYSNANGDGGGGGIAVLHSSISITGNEIHGNSSAGGGGIWGLGSTLTIADNKFYGNIASYGSGSAVSCDGSRTTMVRNRVHDNGTEGVFYTIILARSLSSIVSDNVINDNADGGIWYDGVPTTVISNDSLVNNGKFGIATSSSIAIRNNTLMNNALGGISCSNSSPSLEDNLIVNGYQSWMPSVGISCKSSSPAISNNTITSNSQGSGYGVSIDSLSHPLLLNDIILDNEFGIITETDTFTVMCCDVFNNGGGNYMGTPDQTGVNDNISEDPLFCPEGYPEYTLHSNSPCSPYINHNCGLIGAKPVGCSQTGSEGYKELASTYSLGQNYPNPFNPGTRITFDLKSTVPVSLKVYDVDGRLVRTLIDEKRDSGIHEVAWDGKDDHAREVASGIYFYRLNAGSFSETKKMVLLR
jgi:hypothetical protein